MGDLTFSQFSDKIKIVTKTFGGYHEYSRTFASQKHGCLFI